MLTGGRDYAYMSTGFGIKVKLARHSSYIHYINRLIGKFYLIVAL